MEGFEVESDGVEHPLHPVGGPRAVRREDPPNGPAERVSSFRGEHQGVRAEKLPNRRLGLIESPFSTELGYYAPAHEVLAADLGEELEVLRRGPSRSHPQRR